ncbi:hypothetical protein [Candidatus Avelusimicrobium fimicolum]|uniref:hypothetical protein n=1 Tax=Candidatus Avelusimicrobium fimicolum TaxID=3416216 RepID=UPI003D0C0BA7
MKIGFLIGKVVENPDRKEELDILKVEYKIVYSWRILKKYEDLGYSKEAFKCVRMLSENKVLVQAIETFRKEFGLPKNGADFVKDSEKIRNRNYGPHQPMWCYENFLPEELREKSRKYIQDFIKKHHMQAPLQYQMNSLFYCGYVDNRIGTYGTPLDVYIPTQYDIKERGFGYRLPVSIQLNSATLTKKEVKQFIDEHWADIQGYFRKNPAIIDSHFSEKEVKIAKLREKKYKHAEILEKISPANSLNVSGSTEQIAEQYHRMRKKANKVIYPRESITKK